MTAAVAAVAVSLGVVAWVYVGYPLSLLALGAVRPRPRVRRPTEPSLSVVVAAHDEAPVIGRKLADLRRADYPAGRLEVIVVSNGSTDGTADAARRAGADVVLELPERGKLRALVAGAERASGEVLVFTDADTTFEPRTLRELAANFADPQVGGVGANEVVVSRDGDGGVVRGEGLYWRYDQWIKRLEDRVGSTLSASGRLYAVRRELFRAPTRDDGADDFLISAAVVQAGARLAFDERAVVYNEVVDDGRSELRRKVRVMNQGHRAAMSLGPLVNPFRGGLYAFQLLSHQILRRFVPFFLLVVLAGSAFLAAREPLWWLLLAPQLAFYGLAVLGWAVERSRRRRVGILWFPYFFCLANLAAGIAMLSLVAGVNFTSWKPAR